jgi:hypothetical protein
MQRNLGHTLPTYLCRANAPIKTLWTALMDFERDLDNGSELKIHSHDSGPRKH